MLISSVNILFAEADCIKRVNKTNFGLGFCLKNGWSISSSNNSHLSLSTSNGEVKISVESVLEGKSNQDIFKDIFGYLYNSRFKVVLSEFKTNFSYVVYKSNSEYLLRITLIQNGFCYKMFNNSKDLNLIQETLKDLRNRIHVIANNSDGPRIHEDSVSLDFEKSMLSILSGADSLSLIWLTEEFLLDDPASKKYPIEAIKLLVKLKNDKLGMEIKKLKDLLSDSLVVRKVDFIEIRVSGVEKPTYNCFVSYQNLMDKERLNIEFLVIQGRGEKLYLAEVLKIYETKNFDWISN